MKSTETRSMAFNPWQALLALAGWLALTFGVAAFGALFTPGEWYGRLQKPSWNPPNWIFPPVWSLLYVLMAIAAWLVGRQGGVAIQRKPIGLFLLQLLLNALWSPIFFGLKSPALAMVDIVLLWMALVSTTVVFWKVRPVAGVLLVPYLLWVTFASALNFAVWRLNP